jgi:hypothetical protein
MSLPVSLTCSELKEKIMQANDAHKMPLCHNGVQDSTELGIGELPYNRCMLRLARQLPGSPVALDPCDIAT